MSAIIIIIVCVCFSRMRVWRYRAFVWSILVSKKLLPFTDSSKHWKMKKVQENRYCITLIGCDQFFVLTYPKMIMTFAAHLFIPEEWYHALSKHLIVNNST